MFFRFFRCVSSIINDKTIEIMDSIVRVSMYGSIIDPITKYRSWDFGDGSDASLNYRNPNLKVSHTYANAGKIVD